jgi:hypothetical protein
MWSEEEVKMLKKKGSK